MNLRPYQEAALGAITQCLENKFSTLAVLATGLGKTVVLAYLARRWPGRVLVLAHRDELVNQAVEKLQTVTGEMVGVEMGQRMLDEDAFIKPRLVVSSVQTMSRPKRQRKFRPCEFGLLIIDEAHHAVAKSYKDVIAHFRQSPTVRLLGVTATPKRTDQLAMGQVFESVAYDYGIEAAIDDGWLVPVRQQSISVEGLDFSSVRSIAGDLSEADLDRILTEEDILHRVASPTVELIGDLPTLVFCVTVNHARLMAEVFNRYKPGSAHALSGATDMDERRSSIDRFRKGELQILCNCNLFLEGFDAPSTAVVVMARPTKSLALYTQVLGRGTRPLPGVIDPYAGCLAKDRKDAIAASIKPYMMVLDFVGNSGKHRIISATDLLGGKYGEPIRAYARKTSEEEGAPSMVGESLERAKDELLLLEEIKERKRKESIKARAEYVIRDQSPFGGSGPQVESGRALADPPTDKQRYYLRINLGWTWEQTGRVSKRQASAIISKHKGDRPR